MAVSDGHRRSLLPSPCQPSFSLKLHSDSTGRHVPVCEQVLSAEEQVAFLVACPVMSKPGKAKGHGQAADLGVELRRLKPKYETIIIDAGVEDAPTQRLIIT